MATRVIDDSKLQDIAVAIQGKDNGGVMTVDEMPARIDNIPLGEPAVANPALILMDWEGTILKKYAASDVAALTELPNPDSLPLYENTDHELLSFQNWNWSIEDIKAWVEATPYTTLTVGAIYTTTDSQDHNYWNNPRLEGTSAAVSMQKRATTSIGTYAFSNCYSLTSVNIPSSVTSIGTYAFSNCYSLTSVNIPQGVTSIGDNAFDRCYSLTSVNIPSSVTSIGSQAFYCCYSLTSINIPSSVTSIGDNAFNYCYSLTSVNIPQGVTNIGSGAFHTCYSLTSINIPQGVTSIGDSAFYFCYSLTSVNIPSSVTSIGTYAFSNCYSLTSVNIPQGVTSIERYAFNYCHSLTSVNIPSSVTSIGYSTFYRCSTLIDTIIRGTPSLSSTNAFSSTASGLKFYVPRANLSWFETETNWSTYYAQNRFVAIEDYIEYLESIGYNVDEYKEASA